MAGFAQLSIFPRLLPTSCWVFYELPGRIPICSPAPAPFVFPPGSVPLAATCVSFICRTTKHRHCFLHRHPPPPHDHCSLHSGIKHPTLRWGFFFLTPPLPPTNNITSVFLWGGVASSYIFYGFSPSTNTSVFSLSAHVLWGAGGLGGDSR